MFAHCSATMEYRFITPNKTGKWYPTLAIAQRHACSIGAGYLNDGSGEFFQYCETRLEMREVEPAAATSIAA